MERLVEAVKIAALDVMHNSKPVEVCFGTVTNAEPLEITIDDIPYDKDFLVLTRNVTKFTTKMNTVDDETTATTRYIYNNLKVGEKVILLRLQGGQKYLVLDRVVNE